MGADGIGATAAAAHDPPSTREILKMANDGQSLPKRVARTAGGTGTPGH